MISKKNIPTAKRLSRTMLVVVPIVLVGFYLGIGNPFETESGSKPELEPKIFEMAEPVMTEYASEVVAEKALPENKKLQVNGVKSLRLSSSSQSGSCNAVDFATTELPEKEAVRYYDKKLSSDGWSYDGPLSKKMEMQDVTSIWRVYKKNGHIRVLNILAPATAETKERSVIIYEGSFGGR